jgi:hypothetical protein
VILADGLDAPLPGIYVLDPENHVVSSVNLLGSDVRDVLLEVLTAHR